MATTRLNLYKFADPDNTGADTRWVLHVFAKSPEQAESLAIQEVASRMNDEADDPIPPEIGAEIIRDIVGGDADDGTVELNDPSAHLMIVKLIPEDLED